MKSFLVLVVLICMLELYQAEETAKQDDASTEPEKMDPPILKEEDIRRFNIKSLRQMLSDRNVECKACTEKEELVKRVLETQHLPIVKDLKNHPKYDTKHERTYEEFMKMFASSKKEEKEMIEKLRKAGFKLNPDGSMGFEEKKVEGENAGRQQQQEEKVVEEEKTEL
eukprot:TRINITY_DN2600_c0_g1_i1.p1 TRINITY_DN2600_c0_g1~~TRINITY_DN2600_c0_g1_i1.p1  ORF type:complete len:168 (+),score=47.99 TRINITY_DN2600_c0_g1_i1:704-1207(+)